SSYRLFFECYNGNFWPDSHPTRISQKPESAVYVDILPLFIVDSRPMLVAPFCRAPFNPARYLYPKLHSMGMSAKGKMVMVVIRKHFFLPMCGIMAHQYF